MIIPIGVYSQYSIKSYSHETYNQCESIVYRLEIEKIAAAEFSDNKLLLEFSHPVSYLENSLGLILEQKNENSLLFNLEDLRTCDFLTGTIIVNPTCPESIINLEAKFKLIDTQDCIAESISFTVIKIPFVDVVFSEYNFDLNNNQLIKEITIKNIGRSAIHDIRISPEITGGFISLEAASAGSLIDGVVEINSKDMVSMGFPSGSLPINESLKIILEYNINQCALNEVGYHISFPCPDNECEHKVLLVDENINYENTIELTNEVTTLYYGLCEFMPNRFSIVNTSNKEEANLGDLYNLQYVINSTNINGNTINNCFDSEAYIGSFEVQVINADTDLIIDFSSLTTDPDGVGGLEDLDGDGIYDDLRSGELIDIDFRLKVRESCAQNYHTQNYSISSSTNVRNICGATVNIPESKGNFRFAINIGGYASSLELKRDASNLRYVDEGDDLEFRYQVQYSENVDRICNSEMLHIEVDVPSTLMLNESKPIFHFNGTDTVILAPNSIQDSLVKFEFAQLDSNGSVFVIPFTAVCLLEENTNYDDSKELCEQCLQYKLPRIRISLSKPCPTQDCEVPYHFSDRVSASFYTSCDNIPEVRNGLIVHKPEYYRFPSGFIDDARTIKRDQFATPSDINNRTYFDHDTMLVRIPFEFDCSGSIEDFRLNLNFGSIRNLEIEQLTATLHRTSSHNANDTLQCDVSALMSLNESILTFDIKNATNPIDCILQESTHWLDLKVLIKYSCEIMSNCGLAAQNIMTLSMDEVYNKTCRRTWLVSRDSIYINELYKESFGGHSIFFPITTSIYDEFELSLSLYQTLAITEIEPIEFRALPIIREITYTLPYGYEPVDDLQIVFEKNSLSPFGFLDQSQNIGSSLTPTIMVYDNGTVSYTYSDPLIDNYTDVITRSILSKLKIKNICEPLTDFSFINVKASIEYVDYASGTLETRIHNYEEDIAIGYSRKSYPALDDFQIKTSKQNLDWEIQNTSMEGFGSLFFNNNRKAEEETNITIRYSSTGSQIDSLIIHTQDNAASYEHDMDITYEQIDNNTFKVLSSYSFVETSDSDSIILPPPSLNFTFETSNHSCGFDTLIYEVGFTKEFENETCPSNIFRDTVITYSPPSFPLLEIVDAPAIIDYNQQNDITFSVSNMGPGDISLTTLFFDQLPQADYTLILIDSLGRELDISGALSMTMDGAEVKLEEALLLPGITKDQITQYTFVLRMNNICPVNSFFGITINTIAKSHCGEMISSNYTQLAQIPYIDVSEINYEIDHHTFISDNVNEQVYLELLINSIDGTDAPLTDASIEIYIPKELSLIPGSARLNGQLTADPVVNANDNNRILILDGIEIKNGDVVEIGMDISCTDKCMVKQIHSYLLINRSTECKGTTSSLIINKSFPDIQDLYFYPELEIEKIDITGLKVEGDMVSLIPEMYISTMYADDRSNSASVTFFLDTNHNQITDPDERILRQVFRSEWEIEDSTAIIAPRIQFEAIDICDLTILVESPNSCFNTSIAIQLSNEDNIILEQDIYYCNQDTVKVELAQYADCTIGYRNFDKQNVLDDIIFYPVNTAAQNEIIYRDIMCGNCLIVEQYRFINTNQQIAIQLEDKNCNPSAIVTWEDGNPIPSNYSIEWNDDPTLTTAEVSEFPTGKEIKVVIYDSLGCTYSDSINVPELNTITYNTYTKTFCDLDSLSMINVEASGIEPLNILWGDNSSMFERSNLPDGTYYFIIRDGNSCEVSDSVVIQKHATINFDLPEYKSEEFGSMITLNPQNISDDTWTWVWESNVELSCYACPSPSFMLNEISTISLMITNDDCTSEFLTTYEPSYSDDYYSPNIFNPASKENSRFLIFPNSSFNYYNIRILDRWGNVVYNNRIYNWLGENVGWDGTFRGRDVSSGVYIFQVKMTRESDGTEVNHTGDFLLVR